MGEWIDIFARMDFTVTPRFVERYRALDDAQVSCVDDAIRRLLGEPQSAWARQNRVVGEAGSAWLITVSCPGADLALYWREETAESLVLLLLIDT